MQHQSSGSRYRVGDSKGFPCSYKIILERVVDESETEYKQMQRYKDTHETGQKSETTTQTGKTKIRTNIRR